MSETPSTSPNNKPEPRTSTSLEARSKRGELSPYAQTHSQRVDLVRDLDHLTEQYVQCEYEGCPDLKALYRDGVGLIIALKEPKVHYDLSQCRKSGRAVKSCLEPYVVAFNKYYYLMDRKIADKKQTEFDPMRAPRW